MLFDPDLRGRWLLVLWSLSTEANSWLIWSRVLLFIKEESIAYNKSLFCEN